MGNNQTEKAFEEKRLATNNLFSRGTIKAGKRSGRQKKDQKLSKAKKRMCDENTETRHYITVHIRRFRGTC